MKLFFCVLALGAAAVMAEEAETVTDPEQLLDAGNNLFSAKMFSEVSKLNPGKSVVLSAFSVLTPLAQLSLACVGDSHDQLLKALGLPNDNATKAVFPLVNGKLRSVKGVTLKQASRIYLPMGYELTDEFAVVSRDVFASEVKNVDFVKNVETAKEINAWVESQTNNRIKDFVSPDSLTADTRTLLVNAIYFKGSWKNKFLNTSTQDRDFYVSKNKTIKVPTMSQKEEFKYGESEELDAKLLEMFYDGEESSLLIILPNDIEGLPALQEKLKDPAVLDKAINEMYTTELKVFLPKFKIETTTDLKEVLKNIGVKNIFEPGNSGLEKLLKSKESLFVSTAIQKAFIEINEEGAEAAAANQFGIAYLSAVISQTPVFKADHPFVFILQEKGTLLFNGVFQS